MSLSVLMELKKSLPSFLILKQLVLLSIKPEQLFTMNYQKEVTQLCCLKGHHILRYTTIFQTYPSN